MEFLKEKLGEKYEEFVELLGDTKIVEDDGKSIPYSRFKEVNDQKRELQIQLGDMTVMKDELEEKYLSQEELEAKKRKDIEEENAQMKLGINRSKLETMFVGAGLESDDYKDILENVAGEDFDRSKVVVDNMINVINKQKERIMEQANINSLEDTPLPKGGKGEEKKKATDYGDDFFGAMEDFAKDPDSFER